MAGFNAPPRGWVWAPPDSHVEHMIGLGIRPVHFEDRAVAVDAFRQPNLRHHLLYQSQTTTRHGLCSVSEFQPRRRTPQHRGLHVSVLFFDSALPLAFLRIQLSS